MRNGWLACALLLALALPRAAAAGDFDRFGFYVGGGGSFATALWDEELEDELGVSVDVEDAWGANARAGLRILGALAVEAQYEWLDTYRVEVAGIDAFDVESHVLTANLKLFLPFWRVQPYLLAGVGFADVQLDDALGLGISDSETSLAGRAALGLDVYLTKHIALYAEGGALVIDREIDTNVPGVGTVEPLFYTGAQLGVMFRF
jgi:opacity protein-like surface antigen